MKKSWMVVIGVSLCVLGTCVKPSASNQNANPTVTSTDEPTVISTEIPTVVSGCSMDYYDVVIDTMLKLEETRGLDAVDALITRYDSTEVPYGCGKNDALLDMTDTSVRLALGERRSVFTSDYPDKHLVASEIHANEAIKTIREWRDE